MRAAIALLAIACSLSAHAVAQDLTDADRQWHVLDITPDAMTVVAKDRYRTSGDFRRVYVATHRIAKGAIPYDFDYSVEQVEIACESRDQQKGLLDMRELGGRRVSGRTYPQAWKKPTDALSQRLWEFACNNRALEALPAARAHAEVTTAYRNRQKSPQTSLAAATTSSHWHYTDVNTRRLVAVDVHGAWDVLTLGTRRMSMAYFHARTEAGADFRVELREFDCSKPGRHRQVALADYAIDGEEPRLTAAIFHHQEQAWAGDADPLFGVAWRWACAGDQRTNALPAGYSFVQILESYRSQL